MEAIWHIIFQSARNLFIIEFEHSCDKAKVTEGRLWVFEASLFSMEEFEGITPPSQIAFESAVFWDWMYNLPLACIGKEAGYQIGSTVGVVEEVNTDKDGVGWGEFLRV